MNEPFEISEKIKGVEAKALHVFEREKKNIL